MSKPSTPTINSVNHAISLLEFLQEGRPLGLVEISTRLGLPRATTSRLLKTLLARDLLLRDQKKYRLSLRLLDIASGALAIPSRQEVIYPLLTGLVHRTGMSGFYAVLDGHSAGCIAVVDASHLTRSGVRVGWRSPLSTTAAGKVILACSPPELLDSVIAAGLPKLSANSTADEMQFRATIAEAQQLGYAEDFAEMFSGMYCIAVPVGARGHFLGALVLSAPARPTSEREFQVLVELLHSEARQMAHAITAGA